MNAGKTKEPKAAKKEKPNEIIAYSEAAIRHNHSVLEYCRTSMSALSGFTAGVIGLTGIPGFVFYFAVALTLWLIVLAHVGSSWNKYFRGRTNLLTNGLGGGLFTYVLFWVFLYGMVHVY